jgi:hypothetical protein
MRQKLERGVDLGRSVRTWDWRDPEGQLLLCQLLVTAGDRGTSEQVWPGHQVLPEPPLC